MFQYSLEEAGQRLVEQRQELKEAETRFRTQYEESKRSLKAQLEKVRSHIEEHERKTREGLSKAIESDLTPEQREQVQRDIDESFESVKLEFAKNEAMFAGLLEDAARIISEA